MYLSILFKCANSFVLFCFSLFRAKYHKLKYGTELNQGDMKPPNYDSGKTL